MYGLNESLAGHVQRPERQGSKREISGKPIHKNTIAGMVAKSVRAKIANSFRSNMVVMVASSSG